MRVGPRRAGWNGLRHPRCLSQWSSRNNKAAVTYITAAAPHPKQAAVPIRTRQRAAQGPYSRGPTLRAGHSQQSLIRWGEGNGKSIDAEAHHPANRMAASRPSTGSKLPREIHSSLTRWPNHFTSYWHCFQGPMKPRKARLLVVYPDFMPGSGAYSHRHNFQGSMKLRRTSGVTTKVTTRVTTTAITAPAQIARGCEVTATERRYFPPAKATAPTSTISKGL